MIRCIPVDGSEPFEVEDLERVLRCNHSGQSYCYHQFAWHIALRGVPTSRRSHYTVRGIHCLIESWRERAERLETELAALRAKMASDAMDERRLSEHG